MNKFIHSIVALAFVFIGFLCGHPMLAAVMISSYLIGREFAQAEYRWIEHYGEGVRENLSVLSIMDRRVWDVHSWFWNLILPIAIACALAGFLSR